MNIVLLLGKPPIAWPVANSTAIGADGNSLMKGGNDGPDTVDGFLGYACRTIAPLTLQTLTNVGVGGQTTQQMINVPADVDGTFVAGKFNVLVVQEGTNQQSQAATPTGAANCTLMLDYLDRRRAAKPWDRVVVLTAPMVYSGDHVPQSDTDDTNARLDAYNSELRARYTGHADMLIETRWPGGPFDQARYPDYQRARFFDTTVVNGISNNATWVDEPANGPAPHQRIHYTAAATRIHAAYVAAQLLTLR